MDKRQINFRLPVREAEVLDRYCQATGRSRSDVLREFIRSLERRQPRP